MLPLLILLAALAAIGCLAPRLIWGARPSMPDEVESFGCFEVVTQTRFYPTGWNTGKLGWGSHEVFSLRAGGRRWVVPENSPDEVYNAVFVVESPGRAVIVNGGDPNSTSRYFLLRCVDGQPVAEPLGDSGSADVSAVWLDPDPAKTSGNRLDKFSRGARLSGGRYLLLGGRIVLDTVTWRSFPVPWPGVNSFHVNGFVVPLALSPDARSFARLAATAFPENHPAIGVFDFVSGETYALRIDLVRMRFSVVEEVDRAWLDHHFAWQRDADGVDRLRERPSFVPLPHRGGRSNDWTGYREYKIRSVSPAMVEVVLRLLEQEIGARRLPYRGEHWLQVEVGGRIVSVSSRHEQGDAYVSLWMDRGQDTSLVFELGDRIDRELATGRHDHLFEAEEGSP